MHSRRLHTGAIATLLAVIFLFFVRCSVVAQTAVQFDGANDYVTFGPATSTLGVKAFTLEAWVKRAAGGATMSTGTNGFDGLGGRPNGAYPVLTKGMGEGESPKNINTNFFLGITSTGYIGADFEDSTNGGNHPVWGTTVVPTGDWHHLAATYDGRTWTLYLDGSVDKTLDLGAAYIPEWRSIQHAALATGINSSGGLATGFFSGVIDEPRVWNVVRTQTQIQAGMATEVTSGEGLLGRWGLNDGTGTSGANSIAGSPAGTLTNGPTWVTGAPALAPPAVPPDAPSGLSVTAPSAYQLNISWADNSSNETGFEVWRSADGGSTFALRTSTAANVSSYQDTLVNSSQAYAYRVRAVNASGSSAFTADAGAATAGEGSTALQFGSLNSYVTFGQATSTLGAQSFTLECWFRRTGTGAVTTSGTGGILAVPLIAKGMAESDNSTSDMNYFLGINGTSFVAGRSYGPPSVLVADFEEGSGATSPGLNHPVAGITPIANDTWYHAAVTYDAASRRWQLYLNGALEKDTVLEAGTRFPQFNSVQHASLGTALQANGLPGASTYGPGYFDGVMDEARIWNYARTDSAIAATLNSAVIAPQSGLLGRWGLNEGSGTRLHGNAGTFVDGNVVGSGSVWVAGAPFDISLTAPDAPSGLVVTPISNSVLQLTWIDNAANESGFEIEQSTNGPDGPFTAIGSVGPNVATFNNTGLLPVTGYCYRVRAARGFMHSAYTLSACGTTSADVNSALDLGASGAYVTFGVAPSLATPTFTAEVWFKRTGAGTANTTGSGGIDIIPLITKGSPEAEGSTVDENYILGIQSGTNLIAADFEEGTGASSPGLNHPLVGTTAVSMNVWHHAAATFANGVFSVYLDGVLENTIDLGSSVYPQGASVQHAALGTMINSSGAAVGKFAGVLDEGRIWNYARTLTEIRATINSQITTAESGLLARWGMNEGTGTSVNGSAGTSVNGTITGTGATWVPGAPFNLLNFPPNLPTVNAPMNGAAGVSTSPSLDVTVSDPDGGALSTSFYGRASGAAGVPFTFAVLPDAQNYTSSVGSASPATFTAQTQWCVTNQTANNIKYVSMVGDITNENSTAAWINANATMSVLDSSPPGLPYGVILGNHDLISPPSKYVDYFPASRFEGRPYYGGHYDANNENHYEFFSSGSLEFIVINLSSGDQNPSSSVLDWADALMKTHSAKRAIVVNHSVLNTGNPASFTGPGQVIYDALKDNPNFFLMLGGHVPGEGRRQDTFNGNTVYTVLADYQNEANGGNGWMRLMEFDPPNNVIHVKSYSPTLNQWKTASSSQFDLPYSMGSNSFTLLGTNTGVASGSATSITWPDLAYSTEYEWYAAANDGYATTTSGTWTFTTRSAPANYTITASAGSNGSISPSGSIAVAEGASQAIAFSPSAGYHVADVLVDGISQGALASYTFMGVTANHTIAVTFAINQYSVSLTAVNGTVTKSPNQAQYDSNAVVQLTAVPNTGYHFVNWSGGAAGSANPVSVTMDANKSVTANFAINQYSVSLTAVNGTVTKSPDQAQYDSNAVVQLTAVPNTGYHFVNWSGGAAGSSNPVSVTMDANKSVTANFAINQYSVSLTAVNGTVTKSPDQAQYDSNAVVQLTAVPNTGYHFVNWSGGAAGSANPVSVTMDANKSVTANFAINQYSVSLTAVNGTVTKSPDQAQHDSNAVVQLTAVPNTGYHFTGWSGDVSGTENPVSITMNVNKSATAHFAVNQYSLSLTSVNGSVTKNPDLAQYDSNAVVQLTAVPNTGFHFANWSGGAAGSSNPVSVTMNADKNITANFAINTFTLTYTAGAGGTVSGTSPQTVNYNASGTAVTAVPGAGYHFVNWSDASTMNPRTDAGVTGDISVTANFAINTFTLTYTAGAGGTVSGTSPQTVNYNATGAAVTAVPGIGYHFVNWSDASTMNPRTDAGVTGDISVTANFAINTFTLSYTAGAGGTVSGTSPQTVNYNATGTAVTAVPGVGYHFVNWSDASTMNPRTDAGVTADISVTANFVINTFTLTYAAGAGGTVSGTSPQTVNYNASGTAVTAIPGVGYHFVNWSDASTMNPRTDAGVTADISVTANFAINTFTLTYTAGAGGTVSGTSPQTVNYNASGTAVTAIPGVGYHFVNWSDASTMNPRTDAGVTADISVTANFAINTFTLTYTAGAGGTVSGTSPQTVNYNASGTAVTAVPGVGYHFVNWSDASTMNPRTDAGVTADISVTANFAINSYTITASAGANGSILPSDEVSIEHGRDTVFVITPSPGYHTDSLVVDGERVADSTVSYTFRNVSANHTIRAVFAQTMTEQVVALGKGWNLVSLPGEPFDCRTSVVFPTAVSKTYAYAGTYCAQETLESGAGYWAKFSDAQSVVLRGIPCQSDTFQVVEGWNIVGSISSPVSVTGITSVPGGIVTSQFFSYHGSYSTVASIEPGVAYWVKASQGGALILSSSSGSASASRIRISATPELPPPPPIGAGSQSSDLQPAEYGLNQNYPNPFNPLTVISYQLPEAAWVKLRVCDVLGRDVAILVDEIQEAGYKSVQWNAEGSSSGVYFYRLEAGSFAETRKLMLMR